ncbi:MAG TPA: hypothetical protein PLF50_02045 [Candidatus Cloacimonadota bacterium]|nr:hypothetical protein [Candidatus Cloacimonadota bacterium]HOV16269.1 hypothetical protein [Candidatus Cloacimonadota bacterium]HQL14465.1 hypothetical protein [Candidatus Cloacimonadota bacterium]
MNFKIGLFLLLALIPFSVPFAVNAKSLPQAMFMSAVLPGTGELYNGSMTRGVAFISADLVILFSACRLGEEVQLLGKSYRRYAEANAGAPHHQNSDYYDLLQKYYCSADYNADMELYFRNLGLMQYNNPDYYANEISAYSIPDSVAWQWSNHQTWKKYKSIRRDRQRTLMNQKLAIGAAFANRAVSILDAMFLTRNNNEKTKSGIILAPDFQRNGAFLIYSMEF